MYKLELKCNHCTECPNAKISQHISFASQARTVRSLNLGNSWGRLTILSTTGCSLILTSHLPGSHKPNRVISVENPYSTSQCIDNPGLLQCPKVLRDLKQHYALFMHRSHQHHQVPLLAFKSPRILIVSHK